MGWRNWTSIRIYPEGKKSISLSPWGPNCFPLLALPAIYILSYLGQKVLPTTLHYFFPHWTSTYSSSIRNDWLGEISKGCCVAVPWETVGPLDTDLLKDFVLLWLGERITSGHQPLQPSRTILRLGLIFRFFICASKKWQLSDLQKRSLYQYSFKK